MPETEMIEWIRLRKSEYFPLPVEPLYDLHVAYRLIPMQYDSLRKLLSRHKSRFPARYRRTTGGRRIRLLSATEIKLIRSMVIIPGKVPNNSVIAALLDTSAPPAGSLP